jgi:hypothetical protein
MGYSQIDLSLRSLCMDEPQEGASHPYGKRFNIKLIPDALLSVRE